MGEHTVNEANNKRARSTFIRHLLDDIEALEQMLAANLIENDKYRIGAEQEFCLLTDAWRPAKNGELLLQKINDPHFTSELARYNLEINLDPVLLGGNCFTLISQQVKSLLNKADHVAADHNTKVLLTGILPTISKNELEFDYMTPNERYWALNNIVKGLRGADLQLQIRGVDQLAVTHDSVLFEACNTSFQLHLQVPSDDFISSYNWAQAISGPVLGVATNSPLLLGRELWSETRIALFQQSIDTRICSYALKDQHARVTYGHEWAKGSVVDIFKNDIARHKVILTKEIATSALQELAEGRIPKLKALCLHNGTIYRWNRPCYGVTNQVPHLRIENRYIPSGPSVIDQMANFAFWTGLMIGRPTAYDNMAEVMDFRDAKANFIKAARTGKESVLIWDNDKISVRELITHVMLPIAYEGLKKVHVDHNDIERLLKIIEQRASGKTGSQWIIKNYRSLKKSLSQDDALLALTKSIYLNQHEGLPVNDWPDIRVAPSVHDTAHLVNHIMSTKLFVVNENDLAELATSIMEWKNIHHVLVEDAKGKLSGLLTWTHLRKYKERKQTDGADLIVSDIMIKKVLTIDPFDEIKTAIQLMKKHEFGCLPVVHKDQLIGIITVKDVKAFDHG